MSRRSADAVLQRLLYIVPRATRPGGVGVRELARRLDVPVKDIHRDLEELRQRADYHLAGLGDDIQVLSLDGDRVELWTKGLLQRPVRLTPGEALALDLGLRALERTRNAGATPEDAPESGLGEVRTRLLASLAVPGASEDGPGTGRLRLADLETPVPQDVERAALEASCLSLLYRAPGREPAWRRVAPRELVRAQGAWYLLALALDRDDIRAFRLDRVLEARVLEEEAPPASEAEVERIRELVEDGAVFGGTGGEGRSRATVRYAPAIARWIRERGWPRTREAPDGALLVEHEVADPHWLVGHVLGYGGAARVLEPADLARAVADAAREVAERHEGPAEEEAPP